MPEQKKPNILVIWGDDIGTANLSCYTHGLMGYKTPNIDRLAKEGMMFTDAYGEQSCTAGRSSFITGQSVYRTGLSKVGLPGADVGRMETVDDEIVAKAKDFIKRQNAAGTPFFVWLNTTHMHCRTHTKPESLGQAGEGQSPYHDTMVDHDKNVGQVLDYLDELGIADNTFVMYSTDNGPHMNSWPDAGMTMFRSEKNTNWEGAFRVPLLVRWYPPRQKAASFTLDQALEKMAESFTSGH